MPETNCANHNEISKAIDRQVEINADFERRLSKVESRLDVSDEKFKQVFEKLDEIISILKNNQSRLPNLVWGVAGALSGSVVIWLVMNAIQK